MNKGDLAAERAVLAGVARFGKECLIDIEDLVSDETFTNTSNKIVYKCFKRVLEDSSVCDIPSVLAAASELGLYEIISKKTEIEFLNSLFIYNVKLDNIKPLALRIKKKQIARELQTRLLDINEELNEVTGKESIDHILSMPETSILEYTLSLSKDSNERPTKLFENIDEYIQHLEDNETETIGIPTGFNIYDKVTGGGLRRGSVAMFVARPKQGKSTTAKTIAMHIAGKLKIPVLMLDTEMGRKDQINRAMATESKVTLNNIETGKFKHLVERKNIHEFAKKFKDISYFYKNIAGMSFEEIISIMRRWTAIEVGRDEHGITKDCVIIYDYFKVMDTGALESMQEYQAIGFQLSKMVDFAQKHSIPCVAFVQANRDGIDKDNTSIIAQSDRLLWFASSMTLLKRKTTEEIKEDGPMNGNMKLIPLECRFGPGLDDEDWINMRMQGDIALLEEVNTRKQALQVKLNNVDLEDTPEEDDSDDE